MSNSGNYQNIKLPHYNEGVIRSASVDDTESPEQSVQIGVNINFDRVGAYQTRPGITTYADSLFSPIYNFGTLNNSITPGGFSKILDFGPTDVVGKITTDFMSMGKIDDTHVIMFSAQAFEVLLTLTSVSGTFAVGDNVSQATSGATGIVQQVVDATHILLKTVTGTFDNIHSISASPSGATATVSAHIGGTGGFAQVMSVNTNTGDLTPVGTPFFFDSQNLYNQCIQVDATHYLNTWSAASNDGKAQVFAIDLTTYAVTSVGAPLTFDAGIAGNMVLNQVDSSHFLMAWASTLVGEAQVLNVNLGTYAVTAIGAAFTFDATFCQYTTMCQIDASHFVVVYEGSGNDGTAVCLAVNLGTYAVTAAGSTLIFDSTNGALNNCVALGDGSHFINFWNGGTGISNAQVFTVNLSTFAITANGAPFLFDTISNFGNSAVLGDSTHVINMWEESAVPNNVYIQTFAIDPATFAVSADSARIFVGVSNNTNIPHQQLVAISDFLLVGVWGHSDRSALGSLFQLQGDRIFQKFLYAEDGLGNVSNWNGTSWTTRRTGLDLIEKARFTQYLNRIWMVNGNDEWGDPVMTSDGGDFDTTLVPAGFPPGDFIQGGFEGRVWVADKVNDVVYFTDIVQFTPPNTYVLTYDASANFIKNFSPQNGQTITGMVTTPRALLLFKQDSIYRIYGAYSVDAYPAYNVGTYSQESIVQTKDGLYFHHPSGFYKFAYDSEPTEISRRVIDFVQAIQRTNYENILGIYDDKDSVRWSVGSVTVEGVTYEHCVMRYTISTQVWTIYDYRGNDISALILYDDGDDIKMVVAAQPN